MTQTHAPTAATLIEALPYMRKFSGETFVIKYGGHAMGDREVAQDFARDVVLLKQVGINPVVVHGGGPQIKAMLDRLRIQSAFVDGLRVTDEATVEIVEMVLAGSINKQIVQAIQAVGGKAVGLSGKDGRLIEAQKLTRTRRDPDSQIEQVIDLGFVGEPKAVNVEVLKAFEGTDLIPVIAPIAAGEDGSTYNMNADTAAGAIAAALSARKLMMLTDVTGVLGADRELLRTVTAADVRRMIGDGTISGGMIPKVETCLHAVENGVRETYILDGRTRHVVLLEIFTAEGTGTEIRLV
ncbi:acetylglutamate kinase [Marinivivus vitaminiproducens]|uniref:acetylglutamate kinase n=1 Tax=Marinivivus vitaminiproducens TaxID=3035935 RepID=UPI0027995428|nr:acetylglutamate kinase [Geminicoccaceae bacterium SCSIO 64248]